jgi:ribosomal protein S25
MSDENTQNTPIPQTPDPTDSGMITMPSEAPETPRDTVTPPPVKDDNLSQNSPESQVAEPVQTAQMEPEPEQAQAPETTPEAGTAQSAGNEPLSKPVEPIISENPPEELTLSTSLPKEIPPVPSQPKNIIRELFAKAQQAIQFRKRKKLDRVMSLFAKRTNITNNHVGELLHVSDATATRYLEILEKENKIKQVGKTGKDVSYTKI